MWDLSVLVFLLLFHISLKMEMKSMSFQTSDEISQKNPWLLNERISSKTKGASFSQKRSVSQRISSFLLFLPKKWSEHLNPACQML